MTVQVYHTQKWNCKYHIVFAPKYRRQEIYGKIKTDIGQILRKLCEAKKVEILKAEHGLDFTTYYRWERKILSNIIPVEDFPASDFPTLPGQGLPAISRQSNPRYGIE